MDDMQQTHIKELLSRPASGTVLLSSWLNQNGCTPTLVRQCQKLGWLKKIAHGAYIRPGDNIDYFGALHSLQIEKGSSIHIGGRTALSLLGQSHYLELAPKRVVLFGPRGQKLPSWLKNHNWKIEFAYHCTNFLPQNIGLTTTQIGNLKLYVSSSFRAIMECLYFAQHHEALLTECYELLEMRIEEEPEDIQLLLENCSNIRVKRFFLSIANQLEYPWYDKLDLSKINLGSGRRIYQIRHGVYDPRFQITIPDFWLGTPFDMIP